MDKSIGSSDSTNHVLFNSFGVNVASTNSMDEAGQYACSDFLYGWVFSWTAMLCSAFLAASPAHAQGQVFLCKSADGKNQYQQSPCATAEIATSWTREREKVEQARKTQEDARRKRDDDERAEALMHRQSARRVLQLCLRDHDCDVNTYRAFMRTLDQQELVAAMGPPGNVQNVGGEDYWYYKVPAVAAGAARTVTLQIEFGYGNNPLTNRPSKLVEKINLY